MHVIDNPNCTCGNIIESPKHFFLKCPLYAGPRVNLIQEVSNITDCTVNKLLFGDNNLSYDQNLIIVQAVYFYDTKRFYHRENPGPLLVLIVLLCIDLII